MGGFGVGQRNRIWSEYVLITQKRKVIKKFNPKLKKPWGMWLPSQSQSVSHTFWTNIIGLHFYHQTQERQVLCGRRLYHFFFLPLFQIYGSFLWIMTRPTFSASQCGKPLENHSCLTDENKLDNLQNHVYKSQQRAPNVRKSNERKLRDCSTHPPREQTYGSCHPWWSSGRAEKLVWMCVRWGP